MTRSSWRRHATTSTPWSLSAAIRLIIDALTTAPLARPKWRTPISLEAVTALLGITPEVVELFASLAPVSPPDWLNEALSRGLRQALVSEKARSEFIVAPLLLATQELSAKPVAIYSGQRLDVDPAQGLVGECDFLLSASPPLPALRGPGSHGRRSEEKRY